MTVCALPGAVGSCEASRWEAVWVHHDSLLRLVSRRVVSREDAEDIVHEVLLLAAADPGIDLARAGAWMNRVARNKAADLARERSYAAHRERYQVRLDAGEVPFEEQVCDREEARAVAGRLHRVPARQRDALLLAAEGLTGPQIAAHMRATPKAVENLLRKGRSALRASTWAGLVLGALRAGRRTARTAGIVSAVAAGVVIAFVHGSPAGSDDGLAPQHLQAAMRPESRPVGPGVAAMRTRPSAVRARRAVPAHPRPPLADSLHVRVADNDVSTPVVRQHGSVLTVLASTRDCLERGPVISPQMVGCPP